MKATRLDSGALPDLAAMLVDAGLPTSDLADAGRVFFRFDDDRLAGYGGLEGDGADRLLRSLVVAPDRRREGVGRVMVAVLEQEAAVLGVGRLHLLTTTAAEFFKGNGYATANRVAAPASITASHEFTALCPASAAYLIKTLDAA